METAYLLHFLNVRPARNGIAHMDDIDMVVGVFADRSAAIQDVESMGYEKTDQPVPADWLPAKDLLSIVGTYRRNLGPASGDEYIEIEEWHVR